MSPKPHNLQQLRERAWQVGNALELRDNLMRQLHRDGHSLRDLASAAGMSHEKVRRIVAG